MSDRCIRAAEHLWIAPSSVTQQTARAISFQQHHLSQHTLLCGMASEARVVQEPFARCLDIMQLGVHVASCSCSSVKTADPVWLLQQQLGDYKQCSQQGLIQHPGDSLIQRTSPGASCSCTASRCRPSAAAAVLSPKRMLFLTLSACCFPCCPCALFIRTCLCQRTSSSSGCTQHHEAQYRIPHHGVPEEAGD